jgi:hypothetical protein
MIRTGPVGIGRRLFASGAVFLGFSLGGSAGGGTFLVVVGEMVRGVRHGSGAGGGTAEGTSGLVTVPRDTRGDSGLSLGGVSIAGVIGEGGCSWEIQSIRGVVLGLERREASGLDIDRGAVGGVAVTVLASGGRYFSMRREPAHANMLGLCSLRKIQQACRRSKNIGSSSLSAEAPV